MAPDRGMGWFGLGCSSVCVMGDVEGCVFFLLGGKAYQVFVEAPSLHQIHREVTQRDGQSG